MRELDTERVSEAVRGRLDGADVDRYDGDDLEPVVGETLRYLAELVGREGSLVVDDDVVLIDEQGKENPNPDPDVAVVLGGRWNDEPEDDTAVVAPPGREHDDPDDDDAIVPPSGRETDDIPGDDPVERGVLAGSHGDDDSPDSDGREHPEPEKDDA